ncbi:replication initiator [Nonomuraea indica]|uniref:Replication initiator n=1 Tax=Nonomuraea indica TaxID=1581193 RepID=A0ABW7ZXX5_9ACTN
MAACSLRRVGDRGGVPWRRHASTLARSDDSSGMQPSLIADPSSRHARARLTVSFRTDEVHVRARVIDERRPYLAFNTPEADVSPRTAYGVPVDPETYDYRRAARDALHFSKLVDRFVQNLRRVAGYERAVLRHRGATEAAAPREHASRMVDALRFEPCSPRCPNWLRYGVQPKEVKPG